MRAAAPLAAAVLLAAAAPYARADVADYLGKPIVSVRLVLENHEVTDPELLQIVETRAGSPLSMVEVRETVTRLFALARFEDVQVRASGTADGVSLVYDLIPIHPVYRIEFTGHLGGGIDTSRIRRDLVARYGASPPVGRAPDLVQVIEDDLRAAGYLHPTVTPTAQLEHAPDRATLVFDIVPGPRTLIGEIEVTGTSGLSRDELLRLLSVKVGAPYLANELATRTARYVDNRRSLGYLEAALTPSVALVDNDRTANLTLNAVQGPHVRVVFAGDPVAKDELNALVPIEREGSADEDLLEDSSNRIEDFLRSQGYRDAAAPHAREDKDGELLITFTVRKGPRYSVARVEVSGNATFPVTDFAGGGLQLRVGQPFSAAKLDADVATIEAFYHRQGFSGARVQPDVESAPHDPSAPEVPVTLRIEISENVRTLVTSVRVQGNAGVSSAELVPSLGLQPGRPLFLAALTADRGAIEQRYANLGFQSATVEADPGLSPDRTRADVVFTVREGPRVFVDHVLIVGNVRTKTETIERELQFKSGDPLGLEAVNETERRLAGLGLFRRTDITTIGHGETLRDVLIRVDEAPVTTVSYGGGGEVDQRTVSDANGNAETQLEVAPRVFFEVGRRNLFGKNRSLTLFTRYSIRPQETVTVLDTSTGEPTTSTFRLPEYRVLGTFREPRVFGTQADGYITGVIEQQHRTSFDFARRGVSADVGRRVTRRVSLTGNYALQRVRVFNEVPSASSEQELIDRAFPQVRLSSFSGSILRSTRNDPLDPTSGTALSANEQIAARAIGSEVGFLKSYLRAQWFHTLPRSRGVVLATNATLGIANPFPREVSQPDGTSVVVTDIPASERYFAGGDTTVRGFPLDQLGTPETIDSNGFANGGEGMVILNAELRVPYHKLQVVGFLDSGNVFAAPSDINLGELRSAVGFGIRYKSPVGPIRVDLGFKVHRQVVGQTGTLEPLTAIHISLGQAF